ncbi:MAG: hypothetical protein R6X21_08825 [Candidatus Aminicenantes bacterium]
MSRARSGRIRLRGLFEIGLFHVFKNPPYLLGLTGILALGSLLVARSLGAARPKPS